ncbi:hypothetical protein N9383_05310 [Granulosicoccus sp.]|nr:hypothetical protein [Granulosicoccus sp.]
MSSSDHLTLQTIPARDEEYGTEQLGRIGGFSLHAGLSVGRGG